VVYRGGSKAYQDTRRLAGGDIIKGGVTPLLIRIKIQAAKAGVHQNTSEEDEEEDDRQLHLKRKHPDYQLPT